LKTHFALYQNIGLKLVFVDVVFLKCFKKNDHPKVMENYRGLLIKN